MSDSNSSPVAKATGLFVLQFQTFTGAEHVLSISGGKVPRRFSIAANARRDRRLGQSVNRHLLNAPSAPISLLPYAKMPSQTRPLQAASSDTLTSRLKRRTSGLVAILIIGCAVWAAYHNSFNGPFIFDDILAIAENPTIRTLRSGEVLTAPLNANGATGRPLVNLSLAANYALDGLNVRGYHFFNVGLHLASALLLFGLLYRTFKSPFLNARWGDVAPMIAGSVALLWAVHPLQTESVTFIIQRTELLGGFFLLLTIYCFNRSFGSDLKRLSLSSKMWTAGSIASCAIGMAAKEFLVVAPALILLYDRTFMSGTFNAAWRQRWRFYLGLSATWFFLAFLLIRTPQRNHNVGFGLGMSSLDYLLTQCRGILLYLKLAVWPSPLVVDYGTATVTRLAEVWWQAGFLLTCFIVTVRALARRPALGFLGAWFFVILAPSSSFIPLTTQTIAEHRMYLPLAAVLVGGILALQRLFGPRFVYVVGVIAVIFGIVTFRRNRDYSSETVIWRDTVAKLPGNARANYALGTALLAEKHDLEAIIYFEQTLQLNPKFPGAANNLGTALSNLGKSKEAAGHYERALLLNPNDPDTHNNLGALLYAAGRIDEALQHYQQALKLRPHYPDAQYNLGLALANAGQIDAAIVQYRAALQNNPTLVPAWCRLGYALRRTGFRTEAEAAFKAALRLDPASSDASEGLARLQADQPH